MQTEILFYVYTNSLHCEQSAQEDQKHFKAHGSGRPEQSDGHDEAAVVVVGLMILSGGRKKVVMEV